MIDGHSESSNQIKDSQVRFTALGRGAGVVASIIE